MQAALLLALALPPVSAQDASWCTGRTLRFDYIHTGTGSSEAIAPVGYRLEGEWAGPAGGGLDELCLGAYRFEVLDRATQRPLYSRGFSSIYGEWETTAEAKQLQRAFQESQRFPEPKAPVQLVLRKRRSDGSFGELWTGSCDPDSRSVDRTEPAADGHVRALFEHAPIAHAVDLLVVAEGYTAEQEAIFDADVERLTKVLFETQPFSGGAGFNLRSFFLPSPDAGIPNPRKGEWPRSTFGLSFNAFDSDRYVLTYEDTGLREALARVPYDALILLFHSRKYGGGGIYNLWATCASESAESAYVFVHEFGHSFAGLADEYYSSQVAYEDLPAHDHEPWEPNVTALLDPARLKWRDLVKPTTPLPTPWDQAAFDGTDLAYQKLRAEKIAAKASEEEMEALFAEVRRTTAPLLGAETYAGQVGAFEGAAYQAKGLYRPEVDCIMFTRNPTRFCQVCERHLRRVIAATTR